MKIWLILQTILFESASLYLLSLEQLSIAGWLGYAASHAVSSASFAAICWLVLPKQYKTPVTSALLFIFIIAFSMPLIGMLGLSLIFLIALYFPKTKKDASWHRSDVLQLPLHTDLFEHSQYGIAALKDILLFNSSDDRRLIAVTACRFLPQREAMPLLKLALTDKVDDVRLLAYAAIEKIEFAINQKIDSLNTSLETTKTSVAYFQIAALYWELCYLGIAEGPLKQHYLSQAKQYLLLSEQLQPTAQVQLKLGRVLLELQDYPAAIAYLQQAKTNGLLLRQVAPYLAEAAFFTGDYQQITSLLNNIPTAAGDKLSEVKEFWSREAH
jgi:polysaccharide biosynthesis protein PelE